MTDKKTNIVYKTDASQREGKVSEVIMPKTISELQKAVKENKGITARGGGTGLVGGAVPNESTIIDLSKLTKIDYFDEYRKTIEVEAGVILDELNLYLEKQGFEFPVNPSSHAVCTIGGMIATDAVGSRAIKYGKTSKWIEWIDIVDGQGEIQRKTKLDLADFSGLEGITGVIAKACLKFSEKKERTADFLSFSILAQVIEKVEILKRQEDVSMIEFFDKTISEFANLEKKYHILVEYESDRGNLKGKEYEKILELRDKLYPLTAERGYTKIEDPQILLHKLPEIMFWFERNRIPVFGHISVGILHPCFSKEQEKFIPEMIKIVRKIHGRISGEHGIGLVKKQYLDKIEQNLYELAKKRNDLANKFNPGKIIDF